jgi:hypothetical protein
MISTGRLTLGKPCGVTQDYRSHWLQRSPAEASFVSQGRTGTSSLRLTPMSRESTATDVRRLKYNTLDTL